MNDWKTIAGFEKYEASALGVVRPKNPRFARNSDGLRAHINRDGYPQLCLRGDGGKTTILLHRVISDTFLGPRPAGKIINHKDGIKTNCAAGNLEHITPRENNLHAFANGLMSRTNAKLTEDIVVEVRSRILAGESNKVLAARYGVSVSTIHLIRHGKRWAIRAERAGRSK